MQSPVDLDVAFQAVMDVERKLDQIGEKAPLEALAHLAVARAIVAHGREVEALRIELQQRRS